MTDDIDDLSIPVSDEEKKFAEKVIELFHKMNEKSEFKYNFFMQLMNTESNLGLNFGHGCPACAAEEIAEAVNQKKFVHLDEIYHGRVM